MTQISTSASRGDTVGPISRSYESLMLLSRMPPRLQRVTAFTEREIRDKRG